jgi:hypothetical protein
LFGAHRLDRRPLLFEPSSGSDASQSAEYGSSDIGDVDLDLERLAGLWLEHAEVAGESDQSGLLVVELEFDALGSALQPPMLNRCSRLPALVQMLWPAVAPRRPKISLSAAPNGILYQLSGSTEVSAGEAKTITSGGGVLIAGGTTAGAYGGNNRS